MTGDDLASRLRAGERLLGTVLSVPDAPLAELACSPWDFVWIDLEHSALGVRDIPPLALAARAAGCGALVRLPLVDSECIGAVLDAGVDGVVVPRVQNAGEASRVASALRYPPDGRRGFAHRRATGYGRRPAPAGVPVCAIQIESAGAVEAAAEIAMVAGVDVLVIGVADLALDLGVPAELDEPAVRDATTAVRAAAASAGIAWGLAAGGDPSVVVDAAMGAGLVVYSADVRLYAAAIDRAAASVRAALAEPAARP